MGLNTLTTRASGDTILADFFNDFNTALGGDFVGRATSGVPTSGQNLGTNAIPWGTVRANSVVVNGQTVDPALITTPPNIVVSGKVRTTSNQPAFITPNGAALSFILDGTPTNLALDINGTSVTVTTDITVSSLTAAPAANNTALVNDTDAADQHDTKLWGEPEHRKTITMDAAGTNITALIGKWAAFKMAGVATEYFLAYVESATELTKCRRGFFYDSSLNPINRTSFSDNDVITLMKLGWIFVENNGTTVDVSYNNPTWSFTAPSSPATGDYWYDMDNSLWKRYDGASFQIINRTFVGMFVNDTTACVAARCENFYAKYSMENTLALDVSTAEIVIAKKTYQKVNVAGNVFEFENSLPTWNITTDLATSADMYDATEQASRLYYLYLSDQGETIISDISPYYRDDMFGQYHPHNPWRCVGTAYNDGSSDITKAAGFTDSDINDIAKNSGNGFGSTNDNCRIFTATQRDLGAAIIYETDAVYGDKWTITEPGHYNIGYLDFNAAGSCDNAIVLNQTDANLQVPPASSPIGNILAYAYGGSNVVMPFAYVSIYLKIGDVIRAQNAGASTTDPFYSRFNIKKLPSNF